MNDLQLISQIVGLLQVGFSGFVAIYLLKFMLVDVKSCIVEIAHSMSDLVKQMAVLFEITSEIKKDVDALWREHRRHISSGEKAE